MPFSFKVCMKNFGYLIKCDMHIMCADDRFCSHFQVLLMLASRPLSAILHYMDTGYRHVVQHHQWTSSQQFYNLLYNKFATSQWQSPTSRHVKMLGCGKFLSVGGEFVVQQVVELLWARPLVVLHNISIAGKMLYNKFSWLQTSCTTSKLVVSLSIGGVVQHAHSQYPCSGVWH